MTDEKKPEPVTGNQASADDIKAKFRDALEHKQDHQGRSAGPNRQDDSSPGVRGALGGKRQFRRKSG